MDTVRCTKTSPHTFTCDVHLASEPEARTAEPAARESRPEPAARESRPEPAGPEAPPSSSESDPSVSGLVSRYTSKTTFRAPPPPIVSRSALMKCAPNELSMVLALGAGKGALSSALAMLKAAFDTGVCWALARNEAAAHNAEAACRAQGGAVTRVEDNKVVCEVRQTVK